MAATKMQCGNCKIWITIEEYEKSQVDTQIHQVICPACKKPSTFKPDYWTCPACVYVIDTSTDVENCPQCGRRCIL